MSLTRREYQAILRSDFSSFIERSFYELNAQTRLIWGKYIEAMATKLDACRRGQINRLIINVPPRYLKSHCASVAFVAWLLGHNPSAHIICASYGQELADKLARDTRKLMTSPFYQGVFGLVLGNDRKAVHDFTTMGGGTRMATSVGGPLTGRGADFIIIDDPLKPAEALSDTARKAVNEWYDNSVISRLNDKATGCIIMIMQRLHQDDLVGHVLEQEHWDALSLPAIAEGDEAHLISSPLGETCFRRSEGDLLHPERESLQTLMGVRQTLGEYNFASQYQQNPTPPGGAMVKAAWLQYYEPEEMPAKFDTLIHSWDTASKATDLSDFSVCTTWGVKAHRYYLLHVFRQRMNYPDLKRAVWGQFYYFCPDVILVEDKASGIQLIQELKAEGMSHLQECDPGSTDKVMRLHLQTAVFENGFVLLPRKAPWLADYVQELMSFPGGKYDDQVDSTTQALAYIKIPKTKCVWGSV